MLINELITLLCMEATSDVPVWIILLALAAISAITLVITIRNNRMQDKHRSSQILSDVLKTTLEFRSAIDRLLVGRVTREDHDDLMRLMSRLEVLALCRQDKLIRSEYVTVVYGPILRKLTDDRISEVLGAKGTNLFARKPKLFRRLRAMRDELVGSPS